MSKKTSVGFLAMIRTPQGERCAVLHIRGEYSPQSGKPQLFPGVAQMTVHGGVQEDERFLSALRRETWEEMIEMFDEIQEHDVPVELSVDALTRPLSDLKFLGYHSTEDEDVYTLSRDIDDADFYTAIEPLVDNGTMRLVHKDDLQKVRMLDPQNEQHRKHGVRDAEIAMFPDEFKALQIAFSQ